MKTGGSANRDTDDDFDEIYEEDNEDDLDQQPQPKSRPSWLFTITLAASSMIFGVVAGIVGDGSVEVLNDFHDGHPTTRRAALPDSLPNMLPAESASPAEVPLAWFPDNNHVEWSTSLRPNEQPAAIDVRNESRTDNRRILFQMADGRTYRLAATLFVKAGQQAVIRLPVGTYRVDVASSAAVMPWSQAQGITPIPRYAVKLAMPDDQQTPQQRIFIEEDGKIRESTKPVAPDPEPKPRKSRDKQSSTDYGELTKKSLAEDVDAEVSETSSEE
jgi:hypothetical protein